MAIPKFDSLFNPILKALRALGGSASIAELQEKTGEILGLSEKEMNEGYKGSLSIFAYRLSWARNYLKNFDLLENSGRGVWALTEKGRKINSVDPAEVKKHVRSKSRSAADVEENEELPDLKQARNTWRAELHEEMMRLKPEVFERLCQRLLRESGFIQVEVTGRSGDGGIDGRGVFRVGLLSFRVIF